LWGVRVLRESEERYRLLVESVMDYAIISRFLAHASLTPLCNEVGELRGFAKIAHASIVPKSIASEKDQ
jgi:hypothetical protein